VVVRPRRDGNVANQGECVLPKLFRSCTRDWPMRFRNPLWGPLEMGLYWSWKKLDLESLATFFYIAQTSAEHITQHVVSQHVFANNPHSARLIHRSHIEIPLNRNVGLKSRVPPRSLPEITERCRVSSKSQPSHSGSHKHMI
jgi:hypothetical protein